jgi:hypothetical protein
MSMSMSDELRQRTTAVPSQRSARTDRVATAELRVVMPPALAATIPLSADRLVLGRQAEQPGAPEIGDVSVSRKHFAIEWDASGGFHTGLDLGSSNGSFIDSVRAVSRLPLADGSVVRLGPTVVAVYQSPAVADGDDTPLTSRDAVPGQAPATRSLRSAVGDRHRQGAHLRGDPPPGGTQGRPGGGQLRGAVTGAGREPALRPRPRRVHRRVGRATGAVPRGRRRHAVPRRDR